MAPWKGAAAPMSPHALPEAAARLDVDVAIIRAVWEVESAGRPYRRDGSLERRYEPHHFPGATTNWKDSYKLPWNTREKQFAAAYAKNPEAAMDATSWGGPQIMGFNAEDAGFANAADMVARMADGEDAQLDGFVNLVEAQGLATYLRARDWKGFTRLYNGPANVAEYAPRLERAYRRATGKASPQVLRYGDQGQAVTRLQQALGIPADGMFGQGTRNAVKAFQSRQGLVVDGVVGAMTWEALEDQRDAKPTRQPTTIDSIAKKARDIGAVGSAFGGVVAVAQEALPPNAYELLAYGAVGLGLAAAALYLFQRMVRRT